MGAKGMFHVLALYWIVLRRGQFLEVQSIFVEACVAVIALHIVRVDLDSS